MAIDPQMLQQMMSQGTPNSQGGTPMPNGPAPQQQAPTAPESDGYGEAPEDNSFNLDKILESSNIAEDLDEEELTKIGARVVEEYEVDEESRKDWTRNTENWIKMATQVAEQKNFPWPGAANVKYPLVTTAAMQFSARAYPSLVPGLDVVRMRIVGEDEQGSKAMRAGRVEKHMSYQLLEEMDNWEEDMDKMCMTVAIVGCAFKKTWYDHLCQKPCSELIHAKDLVVNYYATSLETASRKTHLLYKTPNQVKEKMLSGVWLDVDLPDTQSTNSEFSSAELDKVQKTSPPSNDLSAPRTILEQHCFWDVDGDGYQEPYVITVDLVTKKVLRMVARWEADGVEKKGDKIVKIEPVEYFTMFPFIPNPDGGFYPLGFGALLGPLNETVNTLINQLLDAGTMNNMQSGFLSKGVRMKGGITAFKPGEWKVVNAVGDDLKKGIVPLPTNEPSTVLFQLLGTIVNSGKELASIAEIFVGKMPGQNTPATTTMATVEQGMKVFTAIYKRLFRSLKSEFQKLYRLNGLYLDQKKYFTILDTGQQDEVGPGDYKGDPTDIRPAADPQAVSEIQKLAKAQGLIELLQLGTLSKEVVTKRVLSAMQVEGIAELMQVQPQPDPEAAKMQAEMQMKQQESQMKMQSEQQKAQMTMQMKQMELEMKKKELEMKLQELQMTAQMKAQEQQMQMQIDQQKMKLDMHAASMQHEQSMQMAEDQHHMKKEQAHEQHSMKLKQTKEAAAAKPAAKTSKE